MEFSNRVAFEVNIFVDIVGTAPKNVTIVSPFVWKLLPPILFTVLGMTRVVRLLVRKAEEPIDFKPSLRVNDVSPAALKVLLAIETTGFPSALVAGITMFLTVLF